MRALLLAAVALLACAGHARAGRYLLFTTQRSGSTWFCDVLARQPGVQCGVEVPGDGKLGQPSRVSEMMIKYSYMKSRVVEGYNYSTVPWATRGRPPPLVPLLSRCAISHLWCLSVIV